MRCVSAPSRGTSLLLLSILLLANLTIALNTTIHEQQNQPLVQLDTTLEFSFSSSGASKTVDLNYAWDSSQLNISSSTNVGSGIITWSKSESVSSLSSTDGVSVALDRYFSKASIVQSTLTAHMDGSWEAIITLVLSTNLDLTLIIDGDNNSVKQINPLIDLTLFPTTLKDELKQIGLEWLDISILVSFTINWKFIEDLIYHFFDNIIQGVLWIKNQLERILSFRMEL